MITRFKGKYSFLSPTYPCKVYLDGIVYPSALNAYYSRKALDDEVKHRIARATPHDARALAKTIKPHHNWDEAHRLQAMRDAMESKFEDQELARMLADTYPSDIIYESPAGDMFWGTCAGVGKNHLGMILMEIRAGILSGTCLKEETNGKCNH